MAVFSLMTPQHAGAKTVQFQLNGIVHEAFIASNTGLLFIASEEAYLSVDVDAVRLTRLAEQTYLAAGANLIGPLDDIAAQILAGLFAPVVH